MTREEMGLARTSSSAALKFNSDTALFFRQEILRPFVDQYLKDGLVSMASRGWTTLVTLKRTRFV